MDSQCLQKRQQFICSFPWFFFIRPGGEVWNRDHIQKDCRLIAFPVSVGMIQCAFHPGTSYQYQIVAVISHLGLPDQGLGHYIAVLNLFGQWIRFDGTDIQSAEESAALQETFPGTEGSTQTASILLDVADN
jgi:hypothetical protein